MHETNPVGHRQQKTDSGIQSLWDTGTGGLFDCWSLFNVPATRKSILGMGLLTQVYVMPHCDRSLLTPGQPVPELTLGPDLDLSLERQAPVRVATEVLSFK